MFGKPLTKPLHRDTYWVSMALLGSLAGVVICFVALWLLEDTLEQMDRVNQEQLVWDCTNQHTNLGSFDVVCVPSLGSR